MRGRLAQRAGDHDRARYGSDAGGRYRRRLRRVEGGRRPGRGLGGQEMMPAMRRRKQKWPDETMRLARAAAKHMRNAAAASSNREAFRTPPPNCCARAIPRMRCATTL